MEGEDDDVEDWFEEDEDGGFGLDSIDGDFLSSRC